MEIYALRAFSRRARKLAVTDDVLMSAVARIQRGNIDADLGGGLIKQRIERPGQGRSRSARGVLFFRRGSLVLFVHIYLKSEQANLTAAELKGLRGFVDEIAEVGAEEIISLLAIGEWRRIG